MHLVVYKHRASIDTKAQTSLALSAVTVFIAMCRFNEQKNPYLPGANFIQLHSLNFHFAPHFTTPP